MHNLRTGIPVMNIAIYARSIFIMRLTITVQVLQCLPKYQGWAKNGKLVTMSECATMPDPELIVRDNAYWLWFAVWNWDFIVVNGTTQLSDAYTAFDMMEKVYHSDVVITRDELPKELFEDGRK